MSNKINRLQLTITCSPELTDAISDFLVGILEAGVEIGVDDQLLEQTLHAYLEEENPTEDVIAKVVMQVTAHLQELASIFQLEVPKLESAVIDDEDWGTNWKVHFKPFAITPGLVIKPTWEEYTPLPGEAVIEMDPGMAFGTGHHATTSLCMGFIRSVLEEKPGKVLDVGTGTGILAMAAALFGAEHVLGIDNDPDAVAAAFENVAHNSLENTVDVEITPLEEIEGQYSLVVANIIHDVLLLMIDDLTRLTAPAGSLVLSGILKEKQADNIIGVYEKAGFSCVARQEKDEWAALHLVKNS
jgi:ribosomal protein L11 methyltransferase